MTAPWLSEYLRDVALPALRELRDRLLDEGDEAAVRCLNGCIGGLDLGLRVKIDTTWTCPKCAWVNRGDPPCTGCLSLAIATSLSGNPPEMRN